MLVNKSLYVILIMLSFCFKVSSCNLCVDSVRIDDGKISLYLSNSKTVELQLKYHDNKITTTYRGNTFIVNYDTIINNQQADTLLQEMKALREYTFKSPMYESIGYILYDCDNLYAVKLLGAYSSKIDKLKLGNYNFSKLCIDGENKKYNITIVRVINK